MRRQFTVIASAALVALMGLCPVLIRAEAAGWTAGLDLTLEGSAGLLGETPGGQAMQGMALAHADWKALHPPTEGLRYTGYLSALAVTGNGPTTRFLGDFLAASNIEGYPSARLYSWWFEASKGDWSLRGGALLADEEFSGAETDDWFGPGGSIELVLRVG